MIRQFASLLRRIVGRTKKLWTNVITQYGVVFISIGLVSATLTLQLGGWRFILGLIITAIFLATGAYSFSYAKKMVEKEKDEDIKKHEDLIRELQGVRGDIQETLTVLVHELKKDRNINKPEVIHGVKSRRSHKPKL